MAMQYSFSGPRINSLPSAVCDGGLLQSAFPTSKQRCDVQKPSFPKAYHLNNSVIAWSDPASNPSSFPAIGPSNQMAGWADSEADKR